jgi:small subunit ribosomal protein S16
MVRIRLRRVGGRSQPSYRIVAADQRHPRDGRFLEVLGHYNPRTEPATVQIDEGRLFHWLGNGAQASDAVTKVLRPIGTWERWERFKKGEPLEELLEDAASALVEVDPRTRRDSLVQEREAEKPSKAKAKPRKKAPAEETASAASETEEAEPPEAPPEPPAEAAAEEEQEAPKEEAKAAPKKRKSKAEAGEADKKEAEVEEAQETPSESEAGEE